MSKMKKGEVDRWTKGDNAYIIIKKPNQKEVKTSKTSKKKGK